MMYIVEREKPPSEKRKERLPTVGVARVLVCPARRSTPCVSTVAHRVSVTWHTVCQYCSTPCASTVD
eukprot:3656600-Rhodomonas_salina.3